MAWPLVGMGVSLEAILRDSMGRTTQGGNRRFGGGRHSERSEESRFSRCARDDTKMLLTNKIYTLKLIDMLTIAKIPNKNKTTERIPRPIETNTVQSLL